MKGKLLLVEDDENLGFVTKDNIEEDGYSVSWVKDGSQALAEFKSQQFDLCLLDVMLPNLDGFSIASQIRSLDEFVPIIFLTARSLEPDRLKGFETGGDDYVSKPFSMPELLHRIDVFMRRTKSNPATAQPDVILIGNYRFDSRNYRLGLEGKEIALTKMESDLLTCLSTKRNTVVNRSEILIDVWGDDDYFKGRSLDVFISRLRKYLQKDETITIKNHHGVGFMLMC